MFAAVKLLPLSEEGRLPGLEGFRGQLLVPPLALVMWQIDYRG
jgi:hypothetical protein